MNTQELKDLFRNTRQVITDNLIETVFKDAKLLLNDKEYETLFNSSSVVRIVNALYDMVSMNNIYYQNNIVSIFDANDSFEYLSQDILTQQVKDFYETNPKLLNDKFSLNNNFYFTDLRCFIVDLEDSLRQERQGK